MNKNQINTDGLIAVLNSLNTINSSFERLKTETAETNKQIYSVIKLIIETHQLNMNMTSDN